MRNSILLFFLMSTFCVSAQTYGYKEVKGMVVAKDKDVTGVVVQNISTERATITDLDGRFLIQARLNDTLVFSAVQFKRKIVPVNQALLSSSFVSVPLEEFVNELKEVVVNPYGLSGQLGSDITGLQLAKDVSAEALGLPNAHVKIITQSERKLQQATAGKFNVGMILNPPIDGIINAITGRTKMLKNRVKVDKTYARTQRVQNYYTDSIFMVDLKIPKEKIPDFMYFCEVDANFQTAVASKDKLKIWGFLIEKSKSYRANNDLD